MIQVQGPSPIALVGIAYGLAAAVAGAILWKTGRFSRHVKYAFLLVTLALGFAIFSPMLPYMFQELVLAAGSGAGTVILGAALGMAAYILVVFLFSRHFCGYLCPVGAVQELAYTVPSPKVKVPWKGVPQVARGIVFVLVVVAGTAASVPVLHALGIRQFFTLTISAGFLAFLCLVLVSVFVYRPFCRFACPPGVFFSLAALGARWKIRRTGKCTGCGKCEEACPTGEAGKDALKGECYMCRRCVEACPVRGALVYGGEGDA
ncbi:MAG: 4Fe-4S binding protein [Methanolinea sp.]|nr:4Fe-4S binding protein [Methanolinea sp.]